MSVSGKACFDCRALRTRPSLGRGGVEAVRSARPICLPLCGPVRPLSPFSVVRWVLPRREFSLHPLLLSIPSPTLEWSALVHAVHDGSLIIGGAISGSYRRPRCSRRPPPVARGVARVLCLGQTGHRDNPTESSEDARTASSPDQNRLLPGCEPRLSLTPSTPTSRT